MHIRPATTADRDRLFEVWRESARASHHFVSADDFNSFEPLVRDYLATEETEFWVVCDGTRQVMGFMGLSAQRLDSLFLAPECQRRGAGRQLVRHAQMLHGTLNVDVNEQNHAACRFYEACGFVVEGRSPLDDYGKPYPLLHMRWSADRTAHSISACEKLAQSSVKKLCK